MRVIVIMIVFLLSIPSYGHSYTFPEKPDVHVYLKNKAETRIFMANRRISYEQIRYLKERYPKVEFRTVYKTAFNGFSATGQVSLLEKLQSEPWISSSHPITEYGLLINDSVPFIGGEKVRGYFDSRHRRLTGKGIKVGIIDTGVDYSHPDLRKNYRGGFDVIQSDNEPMETLPGEGAPTFHGTHVAGIIAADGKIRGIAPDAEIYAYRALGPGGFGSSEQVITAIEKAIEDGVNIINLSLGSRVNGPDLPTSLALDKAVEKGIIAVTSSGNSGPKMWSVGAPGTSERAISVGASMPPLKIPYIRTGIGSEELEIVPFMGAKRWNLNRGYEIVDAGLGKEGDFQNARGKVVFVRRGELPFIEKVKNAQKAGVTAVIIANHTNEGFLGVLEETVNIPVVSISKKSGDMLENKIKARKTMIYTLYKKEEDIIAPFSSRGPVTKTWNIKPDVVAPGMNIFSTVPQGYEEMHGTSMAAPHVAGACALILQAHPDWSPLQIKAALMNTAKLLKEEGGAFYPPYEQGTGRIQVEKAVKTETLVYPGALTFGIHHTNSRWVQKETAVTVENMSDETQTYRFGILQAERGLRWKMPFSFRLGPREKKRVAIRLEGEASQLKKGIHHGFLTVQSDRQAVHLPYIFMVGEPSYPRVMGFQFYAGDKEGVYVYELFLPGGADELGIALYDPDTLQFVAYLDVRKDVRRGLIKQMVKPQIRPGIYKALVFAKKANKESTTEATIRIQNTMKH